MIGVKYRATGALNKLTSLKATLVTKLWPTEWPTATSLKCSATSIAKKKGADTILYDFFVCN